MKERPILFSGSMVRAIREDRKKQTRRVVNPQPTEEVRGILANGNAITKTGLMIRNPYGAVGTHLWVRETFLTRLQGAATIYRADLDAIEAAGVGGMYGGWKPSIFMPRKRSRLTLEITAVRVERLQEISEHDIEAEGWHCADPGHGNGGCLWSYPGRTDKTFTVAKDAFAFGWDSLNASRGHGWSTNPFVWVISFRPLTK